MRPLPCCFSLICDFFLLLCSFDQITEFSLETVAPIMENVIEEDAATQPEEDNANTDGVVSSFCIFPFTHESLKIYTSSHHN